MSTVLITGAAGFVGGHLIEHLAGRHDVVAFARTDPAPETAPLARWHHVDLLERDALRRAIADIKPDGVFHCAGMTHVGDSWSDAVAPLSANVLATHYLLDALRRAGRPCRVLITGSATVYAPSRHPISEEDPLAPGSPYALSKLAQEQLALRAVREDGVDVVVTRSFNHTGPRQTPAFVAPSMARQIARIERGLAEPVLRVGNLDTERDLTDVRDIVRAYAALLERGRTETVYNVASGVGRSIRTVLDTLLARARVPIAVETDPSRVRANDTSALVGDATRLRDATGWQPVIAFEQMLDDLLAYWRTRSS